jgi:hypothetical protein
MQASMKCKFCGCTDEKPCAIPIADGVDGATLATEGTIAIGVMPCGWLIEEVCTAPKCVEEAYAEAELLADQLQFFIGRSA